MRKTIFLFLVISGIFFYPFGCEGQIKINGSDNNGRYKLEEELKAEVAALTSTLNNYKIQVANLEKSVEEQRVTISQKEEELLTALLSVEELESDIIVLNNEISSERAANEAKKAQIDALNITISNLETEIAAQKSEIETLKVQLAEKPTTVTDTVYVDKIIVQVPETKIDTFTTISDPILLDFTDSLVQPTSVADVYVMVLDVGLVHLQNMDTIFRFQKVYEIERTTDYSKEIDPVTYKNLGLPFQFRNVWETNKTSTSSVIHISATEPFRKIEVTKNNVIYKTFDAPAFEKISDIEFEAFFSVDGIIDGDKLQIFVESERGHLDLFDLIIKTAI